MGVAVNIAAIAPALDQLVANSLRPQFEQETATYNLFEKAASTEYVQGKGFRVPSNLRPPVGVSGIAEGGAFNQPGAFTNDDMFVYPMNISKAFEITGRALNNFAGKGSMIDGLPGYMEFEMMAIKKECNRQVYNDGSGLRSTYKSGTTTVTLYNAIDHTPLSTFGSTKGARHMEVSERYDWYDSTLATYRATVQVTAKAAKTITIAAAVSGATDGDILVLSNSLYKMPRGLAYIVNNDTGTFQLQSRNTYPQLRCPVRDLNGAAITTADFNYTKRLLISRAGIGKAKTLIAVMSLAQDQALTQLGQNFKRWDGDAKIFDQSFDKWQHGDTVAAVDPDCDEDRVYLLVKSELKKYEERPLDTYDADGNKLRMRSGSTGYGADAYTGAIGMWANWGTEEPRCHALIKRCSVVGLATQVADIN